MWIRNTSGEQKKVSNGAGHENMSNSCKDSKARGNVDSSSKQFDASQP